jgi:ABC-2 type transport system ATP-binding protein
MIRAISAAETAPTRYGWAVQARQLQVRAGRRMAVDGLDLSLGTGVHGLLGANGAGKTTLMRALATVVRPAGGDLHLLGQSVRGRLDLRALRRAIGYLPQEFGFYPRFTVREFIEYMAWLKEVPGRDVPGAVQRAVERVGLADRADDRMRTLSGGMLRRAGIAQAIVNDPEVLLLDEPTVGLDPAQIRETRKLIKELGKEHTLLLSTHILPEVEMTCDSVILIHQGKVAAQGTLDGVRNQYRGKTLEDVFVQITGAVD